MRGSGHAAPMVMALLCGGRCMRAVCGPWNLVFLFLLGYFHQYSTVKAKGEFSWYRAKGRVRRAWGLGWRPVLRWSFDGGQRFDGGKLVDKNLMPEMGYMYSGLLLLLLLLQTR